MTNFDYGFSSDLLWKTLWDSTNDGLNVVNLEGNVVACNSAMEKMIGVNLLGMSLTEMFTATGIRYNEDGTKATVEDLVATQALRGEKPKQKRWFQRNKVNPQGYYTDNTGHTLRDENGEITGAFVIIRDVTDFVIKEKEAQENYKKILRESEVLWEAIPDLVFRISKDEVYLDFRFPQTEDLIAPEMEVIGTRIDQHLNDDYGALITWRNGVREALASGKLQTIEYFLEFPEGLRYFEARIAPNGTEEIVAIVRNVSTKKEFDKIIQQSESRFRSIAEAMTNPLLISRLSDGIILYVNQRLYDALKLRNADLLGKPTPDFYAHPEQRQKLIQTLQKQGHVYDWELELIRPNGEHFWVMFSASTSTYDGEEALIASYADITERHITQAQLLQSSKLASLGEMSAGVAHEINTPLATIRLASYNAQQALNTKNFAELNKNLDLINEEVNRTSRITRQMLNFSRNADQDKRILIDVRQTIENIILMLKRLLQSEGIEIKLKLGRQPLYVNGNATQLQQVFYNLAANAKDAVKAQSKKEIEFRIKRRKTKAIFEIEDSGQGIEPIILPNIFEPFFTTKPLGMGTGLGLSVSDNIIKNHDGSIECKSKGPGKGTLFRVILPLKEK